MAVEEASCVVAASSAFAVNDKILPRLSINYVQGHSVHSLSRVAGSVE